MSNDEQQQNQEEQITLEKLEADLDQAVSGWKRTAADFENYKRRSEVEKKELLEFAKEVTVVKLLPTIDALEQALRHLPAINGEAPEDQQKFVEAYVNWQNGVNGIVRQLDKVLGELGVKKIEAIGKKFDPNFHEALREVESEADDGTVVDELQSGFELNGKVIRPSQVVIGKKK